jgi:Ca2+-dependent lipid-binding protein
MMKETKHHHYHIAHHLLYDHLVWCINKEKLNVNIVAGRQIKSSDPIGESDPFVEIYLRMSRQLKSTTVVQDNDNPVWNQQFTFDVHPGDDLIHFIVYDEYFSNNDFIGSGEVELKNVFDDGIFDEWVQLREPSISSISGEIHVIMDCQVSFFIINHLI